MPRTGTTRLGRPYGGTLGLLGTTVTPTATAPPYPSTSLEPAIQGLITPGLVPDIARQSAEVAAGRGVAGSPAAASTAVKMSEQNYLQRLALANQLLSGEADRTLPYQITPFQTAGIGLAQQRLQNERDIAQARWGQSGGGQAPAGGRPAGTTPGAAPSPWAGFATGSTFGTMPAGTSSAFPRASTSLWGGASVGGPLGSGSAAGGDMTLDDIYEMLGFGNFGTLPGDSSTGSPDMGYLME